MNEIKLERHVERLRQGDNSAFDYIYEHTNRAVYFAILYIVRDKMYAEDILHDAYIKAIQNLHGYSAGTNFIGWLTVIARSLALNHLKKHRREVATDFTEEAYRFGGSEIELPEIFALASKILAEDEYEILMLCQVAGYKRREVARMLSMPIATVTWKNNQALKKLKKHILEEGGI